MKIKKNFLAYSLFLFAAFFAFIAVLWTVDIDFIAPDKSIVGLSHINSEVAKALPFSQIFYVFSEILGYIAIAAAGCFAVIGFVQLVRNKSFFKVDSRIYLLGFLYILLAVVYFIFEIFVLNVRPVVMPGETVPEASFPSTHTVLAVVLFGSASFVIGDYISDSTVRTIVGATLNFLAIATVAARILSGVHWITDIVAGLLLGTALLCLFIAFSDCDIIKRRKNNENVG